MVEYVYFYKKCHNASCISEENMARRKKKLQIFKYECQMTGEIYKTTKKADNPDDLVSVNAYYDMHPEEDDRPEEIKKELGIE